MFNTFVNINEGQPQTKKPESLPDTQPQCGFRFACCWPVCSQASKPESHAFYSYLEKENWFSLYPNPANDYLTIEYTLDFSFKNAEFIVSDIKGNLVTTISSVKSNGLKIVDINNWVPGIYIVYLKIGAEILQTEKFTKY